MASDGCAVLISANQMITHSLTNADNDAWRCSEHCNTLLNVSYSADSDVCTLMPIIGLGTAGVIHCPGSGVTIHVLLKEAVLAQRTADGQTEFE
jgi:hypothetical protein